MVESKQKNTGSVILLVIFFGLIIAVAIGFLVLDNVDKTKNNNNDNENNEENVPDKDVSYYDFKECLMDDMYEENGSIYFGEKAVYDCESTGEFGCYLTLIDDFEYCNKTDSIVMITDEQRDFLYNYETKEIILDVDYFSSVIYDEFGKVTYLVFNKDGKEGIATLKGDILIDAIYDSVSLSYGDFTGEYSLKNGSVIAKKNNKVGVLEIETGKVLVPFEYDSIGVYDEHYVLESNDKVVLVDLNLNTVLDDNFDSIVILSNTVFAEKDKKLYFYDLKGNIITTDTITVNRPYSHNDEAGFVAYSMDQYNQVVTIEVYGKNKFDYIGCYDLNLVDKTLVTLDCKEVVDFED